MEENKKRIIVIISISLLIFAYSLYDFIDKSSVKEYAPFAMAVNNPEKKDAEIIVYVSGAVNKPGIFKLPAESRVLDAINTSGGLTSRADSEKINLAQIVKDGQQINVPFQEKPVNSSSDINNSSSSLININTASQAELEKLPGIGPALAQRITEYRAKHGSFRKISDLRKVSGIGEAKFEQIKAYITL